MAYRCEGCGLFCSIEQMAEWADEPDLNDGVISAGVRVYLSKARAVGVRSLKRTCTWRKRWNCQQMSRISS
ncbi:hypothetical protein ES705_20568 [subsurface metagenome]